MLPAHLRGRMRAACKALRPMHSGSWGAFWLLCACGASRPYRIGWHRCLCLEFARALAASACDAAQRVRGSRCRGVCPLWTCAISEFGRNPESESGIRSADRPTGESATSEHVPSLNSVGIRNPNPESGARIGSRRSLGRNPESESGIRTADRLPRGGECRNPESESGIRNADRPPTDGESQNPESGSGIRNADRCAWRRSVSESGIRNPESGMRIGRRGRGRSVRSVESGIRIRNPGCGPADGERLRVTISESGIRNADRVSYAVILQAR